MSDALGRAVSSNSPDTRRSHATSTGSTARSNIYSITSNETGESSSQSNSLHAPAADDADKLLDAPIAEPGRNSHGRGSHRSHRNRTSGGFLLSDATFFDPPTGENQTPVARQSTPPRRRENRKDNKGKVVTRSPDKARVRPRPSTEHGFGGSPLAMSVKKAEKAGAELPADRPGVGGDGAQENASHVAQAGLDVDSAQIVNLALNLSESRRQAARRVVTTPLPPATPGFEESFPGPSLRQHLQAQRRSSRNISPKPEKGDRFGLSPKAQPERISSPLQAAFAQDDGHNYRFSAATLARAEKAKNAIELMAQYRRLLQYLPPLKPKALSRATTTSPPSTSAGPSNKLGFALSRTNSTTNRPLGREYNPLQNIRNRKVRARERQAIDGEAQGFGDVDAVTSWVDRVEKQSHSEGYETSDCVELPPLLIDDEEPQSHTAPESNPKNPVVPPTKVKRPRLEWMINAPDMLADAVWLEHDDNKKLIEDNRERKIFPGSLNLIRSPTRTSQEQYHQHQEQQRVKQEPEVEQIKPESLRVETKLPVFNSVRSSSRRPRIRHKLHKMARELDSAGHALKGDGRSESETSESEDDGYSSRSRRRLSATADTYGLNRDILEKQMSELLARESHERENGIPEITETFPPAEKKVSPTMIEKKDEPDSKSASPGKPKVVKHRRSPSLRPADKQPASSRASLEVPGHRPRQSLGSDLDTTAPNSPESKASKRLNVLVPNISIDLSPPQSRQPSPMRKPALGRVRSKIHQFRDRSVEPPPKRENGDAGGDTDFKQGLQGSPSSPQDRIRTGSPKRRALKRGPTDSSAKSQTVSALVAPKPKDDSSFGARKSRNPITRVGDLIWKKDEPSTSEKVEEISSEDSDNDHSAFESSKEDLQTSQRSSAFADLHPTKSSTSRKVKSFFDDVSTFMSPVEPRGRPVAARSPIPTPPHQDAQAQPQPQPGRPKPPRIDIQRVPEAASPDFVARRRASSRISDLSDLSRVHTADARLNSILGMPGQSPVGASFLPVTGLSLFEDRRRPSIAGTRRWSASSRGASPTAAPVRVSRRDIARVRALLLSSGIKAAEITRRAAELRSLDDAAVSRFADVAAIARDKTALLPVPRAQEHLLAARVLETDLRGSADAWQEAAERFSGATVPGLLGQVEELRERIDGAGGLSERGKQAADEADELAREVMGSQLLQAKELLGLVDTMMRRRRRRFRWLRRGGWVVVEWVLVGVMWWAWFLVVLVRALTGCVRGVVAAVRWLFWL